METTPSGDRTPIPHVRAFISRDARLKPGDRVMVGVSGGADSVCLLIILQEEASALKLDLVAAHLHHGIRGRAADRDAAFVRRLCARLGVPLRVGRRDVPGLAAAKGISLEMAAREARYEFFRQAAAGCGARVVATAHTADDQAETLLLRLARGAGARGLGGIAPVASPGRLKVIRPLLAVRRAAIEAFLRGRRIAWREDETNRDVSILRNRVRHEILPLLERKLNPALRETLVRTADILREESDWLDDLARGILRGCLCRCGVRHPAAIRIAPLAKQPCAARRRVWRLWLAGGGVPVEAIDFEAVGRVDALALGPRIRSQVELPGGWVAVKASGEIRLEAAAGRPVAREANTGPDVVIEWPGVTRVSESGWRIVTRLAPGLHKDTGRRPGQLPARATLSAAAIGAHALRLRVWRPGDRMKPLGLGGTQKLQDIFTNAKIPAAERRLVPVLECDGRIVWLPGHRVAAGWEVSDPIRPNLQIAITHIASTRGRRGVRRLSRKEQVE